MSCRGSACGVRRIRVAQGEWRYQNVQGDVRRCPLDASGALVGAGDIDLQIDQVAANAAAVLAAVGARPDQVVRSVIYVVSDDNSVLAAAWRQLTLSVIGSAFTTASTLLGVTRLGFSGQLVEVDLTAVL